MSEWQKGDEVLVSSGKNTYGAVVRALGRVKGMIWVDISYPDETTGETLVVRNQVPACNLCWPWEREEYR